MTHHSNNGKPGQGRLRAAGQISWQARGSEMPKAPIVYKSTHRIKFSELDPYDHVNTGNYATYYVDHRMEGLRDYAGWDLKTLGTLPFMVWVRRIEIDFLRPFRGYQEITMSSMESKSPTTDALIK